MNYTHWREARAAERLMQWARAAHYHDIDGRMVEADACRMITRANDRGDRWRARVKELQGAGQSFEDAARQAQHEIYEGDA